MLVLLGILALSAAAPPRDGRHSAELSFFAYQLTRPGGLVGYSYRAVESPQKLHALVVGADLGGYAWPKNSVGLLALPRVGWRGRHRSGLQGEATLHLGYQHTFLPSANYEVIGGAVVRARNPGYPSMLLGGSLGIGWYLARVGLTPFARVSAFGQYPVFDQWMLRLAWSVGIEVRL